MDQDNFIGMMVEFIKVHIRMIINRVKGYISGQMEQYFREDGKMACSMDKVSLETIKVLFLNNIMKKDN